MYGEAGWRVKSVASGAGTGAVARAPQTQGQETNKC